MAVFSIIGVYEILDNVVCVATHVNDRLVVHIHKFKQTISNNESQCRDNLHNIFTSIIQKSFYEKDTGVCTTGRALTLG